MAVISKYLQSVKLPVMPEVAHALIRTLNDNNADMISVCAVISKDPALTATLLRMANSAMFGLSRTVNTLDAAVNVIGMTQLRARALSICMAKVFTMPRTLDRLEFWRYSMVCAGYARWLASKSGLDEQQSWLIGMMLRLGQLTIAEQNSAQMEHIELLPRAPGERWARERKLAGFDEGVITAEIARRWDFPDDVVDALSGASDPLAASHFSKLAAVVHLAALLADHGEPLADTLDALPAAVLASLELNVQALKASLPGAEALSDISSLQG
ncbi:HDOD domain-containing protein [Janthinobacterium sp.]|uniref:HDOD domain-containing protein n=1 Tax=Janthinobacterium sp. TaxID=1871054 RepID=UPI00293D1D06|nr:HDOD domain-containing protein [Janthinobacterium sp.]